MSIQSFPIDARLAEIIKRVLSRQSKTAKDGSEFSVVTVSGGLCYVREYHEDGHVTMHGREVSRHTQIVNSFILRNERAHTLAAKHRLERLRGQAGLALPRGQQPVYEPRSEA